MLSRKWTVWFRFVSISVHTLHHICRNADACEGEKEREREGGREGGR